MDFLQQSISEGFFKVAIRKRHSSYTMTVGLNIRVPAGVKQVFLIRYENEVILLNLQKKKNFSCMEKLLIEASYFFF